MWDTIIISPFTNILLFIYTIAFSNYGLAIILFTCLIRLATHPLMVQQIRGAQKMQDMQKDARYVALQTKYKGDKKKLQEEQAKMMQELKINPLASCLPTLIQFPIIIGLYQVVILALANTPMELVNLARHVYPGFLNVATLIPLNSTFLWMDLSQPERLIIPGLSFGIPILAVIVVVTTYMQSKMMTPPSSNPGDQSAMVGNMMNIYMPFLMGYLALTLASGLALYFVVSNLIGIFQYAMLGKLNWRNLLPAPKSSAVIKGGSKK
ncbi:MAG: membrane protein insertase YidC [Planctomycetes bacterium]|nr:membrane protein insertase YidC [Planctomycetota bacterium]